MVAALSLELRLMSATPLDGLPDDELVGRVKDKDEASFAVLVRRHSSKMLWVVNRIVRNKATAEELVQDTWLVVVEGLGSFENRSSFKTWLFRILTNKAITRAQREARSVPESSLRGVDDLPVSLDTRFDPNGNWLIPPSAWGVDTPEEIVSRDETLAVVSKTIGEMPSTHSMVIMLRDKEGWTSEEVCEFLNLSEANQRVILHRARAKVRDVLEKLWGKV